MKDKGIILGKRLIFAAVPCIFAAVLAVICYNSTESADDKQPVDKRLVYMKDNEIFYVSDVETGGVS